MSKALEKSIKEQDPFKLYEALEARYNYLYIMVNRDFGGGCDKRNAELREVKYWKEALERGEFK